MNEWMNELISLELMNGTCIWKMMNFALKMKQGLRRGRSRRDVGRPQHVDGGSKAYSGVRACNPHRGTLTMGFPVVTGSSDCLWVCRHDVGGSWHDTVSQQRYKLTLPLVNGLLSIEQYTMQCFSIWRYAVVTLGEEIEKARSQEWWILYWKWWILYLKWRMLYLKWWMLYLKNDELCI